MNFILEPHSAVVPFYFGDHIENYTLKYSFNLILAYGEERWNEYNFFDETIEVYVDKTTSKIESISCRDNCYYGNLNLIGLNINDFFSLFKILKSSCPVEKIFLTNEEQLVYDVDQLGLQLWVNESNEIVTIFISE